MNAVSLKAAASTTCTPSASMSATYSFLPSGEKRMSCGMPFFDVQISVVGPPAATNLSFSRVDGIGSTR